MPLDSLLIGEAALALGVPEKALRRACDAGVIAVPRAGRVRLFPVAELDHYRRTLAAAGYVRPVGAVPSRPVAGVAHPAC